MEALLKNGFINREKPEIFYEVIKSFATVKNKRNNYAHGLWFTPESGKIYLAKPTDDIKLLLAINRRKVTLPERLRDGAHRHTSTGSKPIKAVSLNGREARNIAIAGPSLDRPHSQVRSHSLVRPIPSSDHSQVRPPEAWLSCAG